jgi:hypothetical protein
MATSDKMARASRFARSGLSIVLMVALSLIVVI